MPAPSQVYLTAIGPPALNAVLVTLILPNVFSLVAGLPELFAGGAVAGVVVVFVVLVDEPEDFDAGGLAAVEVVAGVVDPWCGPVGVGGRARGGRGRGHARRPAAGPFAAAGDRDGRAQTRRYTYQRRAASDDVHRYRTDPAHRTCAPYRLLLPETF